MGRVARNRQRGLVQQQEPEKHRPSFICPISTPSSAATPSTPIISCYSLHSIIRCYTLSIPSSPVTPQPPSSAATPLTPSSAATPFKPHHQLLPLNLHHQLLPPQPPSSLLPLKPHHQLATPSTFIVTCYLLNPHHQLLPLQPQHQLLLLFGTRCPFSFPSGNTRAHVITAPPLPAKTISLLLFQTPRPPTSLFAPVLPRRLKICVPSTFLPPPNTRHTAPLPHPYHAPPVVG